MGGRILQKSNANSSQPLLPMDGLDIMQLSSALL